MFCVNCGAAVSEGASFCGGCSHPVSAGNASSPDTVKEAVDLKKLRKMNIVGAIGMATLWGAVLVMVSREMPALAIAVFAFIASLTIGAPTASALAFSHNGGAALRWVAIGLNVALILVWVLSAVENFLHSPASLPYSLGSALFYVLPEVINIRALHAIRSGASMQPA